jgi:nicotinamide mononucleotide transporter
MELGPLLALARAHALEIVATLFGVVSVYLSARENIWSWPTALVNVLLSVPVYYAARLYSDMGLQVVYAALSVYGWYEWLHGGENRTELPVSRTPLRQVPLLVLSGGVAAVILGTIAARYTNASWPYLDASLTAASLVAQWMMTRKLLENWALWIAVDVVYVPLLAYKHLYEFAILYVIFLGLAVAGHVEWSRSLRARLQGLTPHPPAGSVPVTVSPDR